MSDNFKGQYLKAAADVMILKERIKQLEQELAVAKKDQARYQFLRNRALGVHKNDMAVIGDFDSTIDAAIKESSK